MEAGAGALLPNWNEGAPPAAAVGAVPKALVFDEVETGVALDCCPNEKVFVAPDAGIDPKDGAAGVDVEFDPPNAGIGAAPKAGAEDGVDAAGLNPLAPNPPKPGADVWLADGVLLVCGWSDADCPNPPNVDAGVVEVAIG